MGPRLLAQQTTEERAITYADAGVDIERANRTKQRIKYLAHKTFNRGVLSEIGGFGGLFAIDKKKYLDPVLVSSVDGVGTKLKIAFEMGLHHTIGADLVNHCVNDIAVQGAAPMFFRSGAGFERGWRRHQAQDRLRNGTAPHHRRRPGQSLRQRHRRAGRRAHVLPIWCWFRAWMASAPSSRSPSKWDCTTPSAPTWSIIASTTSPCRAPRPCSSDLVLVSSVDGVGTKLKIAFEMGLHHTIGADLVNHCVNDIAVQGAAPMFFMEDR